MEKYCVIGGQYVYYNHGVSNTLIGAKRLASKNCEYWDNWQGWHKPSIYRFDDCHLAETFYGKQIIPNEGAYPVSVWDGKRWEDNR